MIFAVHWLMVALLLVKVMLLLLLLQYCLDFTEIKKRKKKKKKQIILKGLSQTSWNDCKLSDIVTACLEVFSTEIT